MRSFLILLLGALILGFMALYNGYPLTYPDTGTYIRSGFTGEVPLDRPLTYGLFLRHSSLSDTLWLTLFFQCLLSAWCVRFFIRSFVTRFPQDLLFLGSLVVLALFTSASQKTSTLLPDFITAPLGLLLVAWLLKPPAGWPDRIISGIILVYGLTMHTSHLYIALLAIALMLLLRLRKSSSLRAIEWKRAGWATAFIVVGFLLLGLVNLGHTGRFFTSQSRHIFLMHRLADAGLAEEFLDRHCAEKNYVLCPYKDSLSQIDFLWDYGRSALYKTGGWEQSPAEYDRIIGDMLKDPHMLKRIAMKSAEYSIRQFFDFRMDLGSENPEQGPGSPSQQEVDKYFHHELRAIASSLQNNNALDYSWLNRAQQLLVIFSWCVLGLLFGWKRLREAYPQLCALAAAVTIFCLANAIICGTLATFLPRFQTRVIWLFPLLLFVILAETGVLGRIAERVKRLFTI